MRNIKMALRRVLVIYKCRRFARTDKHTPINLIKTEKAKVLVNVTHFCFLLLYVMANLFHGVLDKSL